MVGGAVVSSALADRFGADGYGKDAAGALAKADELLGERR
jgi:methanogenic corrinoid protein MtbC1